LSNARRLDFRVCRIGRSPRISEPVLAAFIEAVGRAWPGGWRKRAKASELPRE
jgi:hypothetical protein